MRNRLWLAALLSIPMLMAMLALAIVWWRDQPRSLTLWIEHRGRQELEVLELHGSGLATATRLVRLAPGAALPIELLARRQGELRLRVVRGSVSVEARLLADAAVLAQIPYTLVIGPGQRYVLEPRLEGGRGATATTGRSGERARSLVH